MTSLVMDFCTMRGESSACLLATIRTLPSFPSSVGGRGWHWYFRRQSRKLILPLPEPLLAARPSPLSLAREAQVSDWWVRAEVKAGKGQCHLSPKPGVTQGATGWLSSIVHSVPEAVLILSKHLAHSKPSFPIPWQGAVEMFRKDPFPNLLCSSNPYHMSSLICFASVNISCWRSHSSWRLMSDETVARFQVRDLRF